MHFDKPVLSEAEGLGANGAESPSPLQSGLQGLCPRCGASALFSGFARFAERCRVCGLYYTAFNVGDGPAAFLTLVVGTVIVGLAIALQLSAHPPFRVHILLWLPLTVGAVLGALRVTKGVLIALEYHNRAREGKIAE